MSAKNKITVQLLRSNEVVHDPSSEISQHFGGINRPKTPNVSDLELGEVTLNVAKNYEIIGVKNSNGEFVYLPFNLAVRMLQAEHDIDELTQFGISNINALSAATVSLYNNLEEFKIEIRNELSQTETRLDNKINNLSSNTYTTINNLKSYVDNDFDALNDKINSLSGYMGGDVSALYDYIDNKDAALLNKIVILSGETNTLSSNTVTAINELNLRVDAASAYTTTVSGNLYTYINEKDGEIINRLDNFPLSGISDIQFVDNEYFYDELDRTESHDSCYIQTLVEGVLVTLHGQWEPDAYNLMWEISDYQVISGTPQYIPDLTQPVTANTEEAQVTHISFVDLNGDVLSLHAEPNHLSCSTYSLITSLTGQTSQTTSEMGNHKISLDCSNIDSAWYVYVPDAPEDLEVYYYDNITSSTAVKLSLYQPYDNVWLLPDTVSTSAAIALVSASHQQPIILEIKFCAPNGGGMIKSVINICAGSIDGGIPVRITDEDPNNAYEVLVKDGDIWTNQIVGVASKERYGIVKVGDNINVSNGVISVTVDQTPMSSSTNPVASSVVYEAVMSMNTLTNEEMDILLGGPLPVYLMDDQGEMVVDEDGNFIELI